MQDLFAPARQERSGATRRLDAAAEMQRLLLMSRNSLNAEADAIVAAVMGWPSDEECQLARDELVAALAALEATM